MVARVAVYQQYAVRAFRARDAICDLDAVDRGDIHLDQTSMNKRVL